MNTCSHLDQIQPVKPQAAGCEEHFCHTHHPIVRSFEPGEDWMWCCVDQLLIEGQ